LNVARTIASEKGFRFASFESLFEGIEDRALRTAWTGGLVSEESFGCETTATDSTGNSVIEFRTIQKE
jgi:hypothetical protein